MQSPFGCVGTRCIELHQVQWSVSGAYLVVGKSRQRITDFCCIGASVSAETHDYQLLLCVKNFNQFAGSALASARKA